MRSYSRNSRGNFSALGVAAAVSMLLGSAVHSSAVQAGESTHSFVLTAYSNGTGGEELISGNYAAAAESLSHRHTPYSLDASTISNNRCVALALTKQWDSARVACDRAVRDAQQERTLLPSYQYWGRKLKDDYLAVALSNRAVLHWLSSDSTAAASDLKRAEALSPKADFVARNRAALEYSRTSVAKVAVVGAP
jgi:hypothetical protein